MNLTLKNFQKKAIVDLVAACRQLKQEILLKSCTGSGKTIILTHFIDRYLKENSKTCFVWFTPGKGNLEDQSKSKMDKYIHNSQTKLLGDVLTGGFAENDVAFINWEMVTNKKNNAIQDSEHANLMDRIRNAHLDGLNFIVIVDEQHFNNTYKANEIIRFFNAEKIIRASATPQNYGQAILIDINEEVVITEGLIKKNICINEKVQSGISVANEAEYLIKLAVEKQALLKAEFRKAGSKVKPLIVVQLPNKSEALQADVEKCFDTLGINYINHKLAVWLADQKENLENIDDIEAEPIAIIIKQAVALGWDCPRAHILVKLRDNMSETFEIQTIGRIRRMPEAKHYSNIHLDNCYIYSFDEKFIENTKNADKKAGISQPIFLKNEFKQFSLTKEIMSTAYNESDPVTILKRIQSWYKTKFSLSSNFKTNKTAFEAREYEFGAEIKRAFSQGSVKILKKKNIDALNHGEITKQMDTHAFGRQFHHDVGEIADTSSVKYDSMVVILRRLFDASAKAKGKLLDLTTRELYSFVINNVDLFKRDIKDAIAGSIQTIITESTNEREFTIPQESKVIYDPADFVEFSKSVYFGYAFSGDNKSAVEIEFEYWCENNADWFYKNGDKGVEYFSIAYEAGDKQKLFYPDYIVKIKGKVWIIETKGGVSAKGDNEDIDDWSAIKFQYLKNYLIKHNLNGGFVVFNKGTRKLLITTSMYSKYERGNKEYKQIDEIIK